tara:strand:+ start:101 stop:289 length:189 start_codon:yes stop_codon:yes gene_type:complete
MREEICSKTIAQLIKFMNKLPHQSELHDKAASITVDVLALSIQKLIKDIDKFADLDARGWIK